MGLDNGKIVMKYSIFYEKEIVNICKLKNYIHHKMCVLRNL